MDIEKINIKGLHIAKISYGELQNVITNAVAGNSKTLITYANANIINIIWKDKELVDKINTFDVIHPDGIGIYLASKFLYGSDGFQNRFSGSDFYSLLTRGAVSNNWELFFFGHSKDTLNRIKVKNPDLNVCGLHVGYNFSDEEVISQINQASPDILVIGLSFPKQEEWLFKYRKTLNAKVCICVGDGIKVFAGNKIRGPKIMRKLGMEWFIRFLVNPLKYFRRYIIGNPLFLGRIMLLKFRKFKE